MNRSMLIAALFALLTAAKGLKWFQSGAAGFDHPIFAKVAATGCSSGTTCGAGTASSTAS